MNNNPASGDFSLPGPSGKKVAELLRDSVTHGRDVLAETVASATRRMLAKGRLGLITANAALFTGDETRRIEQAIGAASTAAELLGRVRVQRYSDLIDHWGRDAYSMGPLEQFSAFPQFTTLQNALHYFRNLTPKLGIDPERYGAMQERHAFHMAVATEQTLLDRVKASILDYLGTNWWEGHPEGSPTGEDVVKHVLDAAGVSPANPQYAEMCFRTNVLDSFHTGMDRQLASPQMQDRFPVWQYLGIDDIRAGDDHRPKFDKYYPSSASFAEVRGDRPYSCRCSKYPLTAEQWAALQSQGAVLETSW